LKSDRYGKAHLADITSFKAAIRHEIFGHDIALRPVNSGALNTAGALAVRRPHP